MRDTRDAAKTENKSKSRATLRTIAEITGLSLSTVSLSLRGGASLKEETRRKVEEAARAVGYVPDRAGVRLRTGKTNVIALVLDGAPDSIDFAQNMIQGVGHAIKGTRYHLTVTPEFERTASVDSIRYILDNRTADGVIITHTAPRDPRVQLMMDADFPFVTHGRTEFFTPHAYHDFHSEAFARLAVERLVSKGRRKLMLAIGDDSTTNYHNIVTTFKGEVTRAGISGTLMDTRAARGRSAELRAFGIALAASPERPDGIICDSETRAIALISGLYEGGLRIGREFDLISKQTTDILPTVFPDVDSLEEDVYFAGTELTRLLLRRIEGEMPENLQTLSEPIPHWH
ncbi:LacI family transcriptional regulator [Pelagibacterium halotolerans]|uniref:LacI family transcriptional regulator n=1 Tax=Pelagibacterium halotolerans TaxID=531813 RepID=UPI00384E31A8